MACSKCKKQERQDQLDTMFQGTEKLAIGVVVALVVLAGYGIYSLINYII